MIVPQAEIDLILNPRLRRRMMRLPADTSRCPVHPGRPYRLQSRPFTKAQATITVLPPIGCEQLGDLSLEDAKREGFGSIAGARAAWRERYGGDSDEQLVWVVTFAKGDISDEVEVDQPVYLAKIGGDYTTQAHRQAVPGDPEVTVLPGAGEQARVMDLAGRVQPQRQAIRKLKDDIGELAEDLKSMKARNRVRLIQRQLDLLRGELPVADLLPSPQLSANGSADRSAAPHPSR